MSMKPSKPAPDPAVLEEFKDEVLIKELLRRCDHGVIAMYRVLTDNKVYTIRRWKGNSHLVSGLSLDMATSIIHEIHAVSRPDYPRHCDWDTPLTDDE